MRVNGAVVSGCLSGDGSSVGPIHSRVMCPRVIPATSGQSGWLGSPSRGVFP